MGFIRDCEVAFQQGADGGSTALLDTADRICARNGWRGQLEQSEERALVGTAR